MIRKWLLGILLSPISLLYGIGISIRNFFYESRLLKPVSFSVPVISIGNLSVGGSGKTPHVEYLIRYLRDYLNVATMSRGYGRKTRGFRIVLATDDARKVGDEPLQFKRKFPDIAVSVSERRAFGIPNLLASAPETQVILLDDAFQHRAVSPFVNILLTTHSRPYFRDFLLPSGRLREWPSSAVRADIIIVTKCPPEMSVEEQKTWIENIEPVDEQRVFFSSYQYERPYAMTGGLYEPELEALDSCVLLSALASSEYLEDYVESKVDQVAHMTFNDHHYFLGSDISKAIEIWENLPGETKCILTTEKDAMRLEEHREELERKNVPVLVLPIRVVFERGGEEEFHAYMREKLLSFKS